MRKSKILLTCFFVVLLMLALLLVIRNIFDKQPAQVKMIAILKTNDVRKEFWQTVSHGIQSAQREFDVIVDVRGPLSDTDAKEQVALLRQAISEEPDVILLAPVDIEALVPAANEVKKSGIRLIVIDTALQTNAADAHVITDNIDAGRKAGVALAEQLKPQSKIAIVSSMENYQVSIPREQGVREALAEQFPHIEIVGTYFNHSDEGTYAATKVIFSEHKDLAGIVVLDSFATVGVSEALKVIEGAKAVKLVGFDSSINEIKLLEEGMMAAVVVRKPFNMGYLAIKAAVDIISVPDVAPVVPIESVVITQNNMYEPENQRILFPFIIQ